MASARRIEQPPGGTMRRFSIRSLMAFIVVAAVGLAALGNANELWAGMLLLAALGAVGFAVMGAAILRGKERYWWAGFAFFGGGYLALAVGPWISDTFQPQLGTTPLLDHVRRLMFASSPPALSDAEMLSLSLRAHDLEAVRAKVIATTRAADADPWARAATQKLRAIQGQLAANKNSAPLHEHFQRAGHSLFALLVGLVGGTAATWLYVRREIGAGEAESSSQPQLHRAQHAGEDVA
jgi:hypothetical protein